MTMTKNNGNTAEKRFFIGLAAAIGALAIIAGSAYGYWAMVEDRFLTITEGRVYRSGAMPPEELQRVVEKNGIRTVIDLRRYDEKVEAERKAMAAVGVRHLNIHSEQIPRDDVVSLFVETLGREEVYPVLIHCNHGIGRAVLFSAIYRMEFEGWDRERAREAAYWRSMMGDFETDDGKGNYIMNYTPIRKP